MSLGLAFKAFFKILSDPDYARRVAELSRPAPPPPPAPTAAQLLAVLQREGRFVDFLQEDLSGFPDEQVGAVARAVQQGCRKAAREYLQIEPVLPEAEGSRVTVPPGFDPSAIRLVGRVEGEPPFQGVLRHHGWRLVGANLPAPPPGADATVLLPAEVEIQ
jgi:hypothetical protein